MDSTTKQIPEWFEKWISDWLRENVVTKAIEDEDMDITLDRHNAKTTWARAIAYAAYRHLSGAGGGMRWIPVDEKNPDKPGRYYTQYKGSFESWLRKDLIYWNGTQWLKGPKEVKFWLYEPEPPTP